ncbi:MAG: T9SS type A sorting domain-containing protein [Saprospiraceae bacterium]|nr:T9SS type A sorting domain-containing protein [Saprospiraceae bacterium]
MKQLITYLLLLLSSWALSQPSIHYDLQQSIGHEWGLGVIEDLPFDSFPSPLAGENLTWDFSFIGDMDNGFGVPFSQAELVDFHYATFKGIEGLQLDVGGTAQDSFPFATGGLFQGDNPDEYYDIIVIDQNEDGIFFTGEINHDGAGSFELDDRDSILFYPTGLAFGEQRVQFRLSWSIGSNTVDSLTYVDSFTFVGYGTAKMYYGDVTDVVLYHKTSKKHFWSHSVATGALTYESFNYESSYMFLQNGNMLPLLIYSFVAEPDWTPSVLVKQVIVPVPFFQVINSTAESREPHIDLSVRPNPVQRNWVTLNYNLAEAVPSKIELFTVFGQKMMEKCLATSTLGAQSEQLFLPATLPLGYYYLRLTNGLHTGIQKICIGQ